MTQYHLTQASGATLRADGGLVRAADVARIGELEALIASVAAERDGLPAEREAARAEGFEAGRAEGAAAGRAEALETSSAELAAALSGLGAHRRDTRAEATTLAFAVVRRVLPQIAGDAMLGQLIETAATELQEEQPHAVRVAPSRADAVAAALAGTGLGVEADDSLEEDDAVLMTQGGTAEAGLEARLGVLMDALRG